VHDGAIEARSDGSAAAASFVVRLPLHTRLPRTPTTRRSSARARVRSPPPHPHRRRHRRRGEILAHCWCAKRDRRHRDERRRWPALDRARRVHLIISDISMPEMDGYQSSARCARSRATTHAGDRAHGLGREADQARSRQAASPRHVTKPVNFADLACWSAARSAP